jgi:hypothetical protein
MRTDRGEFITADDEERLEDLYHLHISILHDSRWARETTSES